MPPSAGLDPRNLQHSEKKAEKIIKSLADSRVTLSFLQNLPTEPHKVADSQAAQDFFAQTINDSAHEVNAPLSMYISMGPFLYYMLTHANIAEDSFPKAVYDLGQQLVDPENTLDNSQTIDHNDASIDRLCINTRDTVAKLTKINQKFKQQIQLIIETTYHHNNLSSNIDLFTLGINLVNASTSFIGHFDWRSITRSISIIIDLFNKSNKQLKRHQLPKQIASVRELTELFSQVTQQVVDSSATHTEQELLNQTVEVQLEELNLLYLNADSQHQAIIVQNIGKINAALAQTKEIDSAYRAAIFDKQDGLEALIQMQQTHDLAKFSEAVSGLITKQFACLALSHKQHNLCRHKAHKIALAIVDKLPHADRSTLCDVFAVTLMIIGIAANLAGGNLVESATKLSAMVVSLAGQIQYIVDLRTDHKNYRELNEQRNKLLDEFIPAQLAAQVAYNQETRLIASISNNVALLEQQNQFDQAELKQFREKLNNYLVDRLTVQNLETKLHKQKDTLSKILSIIQLGSTLSVLTIVLLPCAAPIAAISSTLLLSISITSTFITVLSLTLPSIFDAAIKELNPPKLAAMKQQYYENQARIEELEQQQEPAEDQTHTQQIAELKVENDSLLKQQNNLHKQVALYTKIRRLPAEIYANMGRTLIHINTPKAAKTKLLDSLAVTQIDTVQEVVNEFKAISKSQAKDSKTTGRSK